MPRYNKCANPAAANNITGWLSNPTASRVTGQTVGTTGRTTAAQITASASAYGSYLSGGAITATAATAGGLSWSYVAWVWSGTARTIRHYLIRWNGTSSAGVVGSGIDVALTANTWTAIRATATIPTGGTYTALDVHIDFPTAGTSAQFRMSAVRVEQITDNALVFADGDNGAPWSWDGTAGSSTSTQSDSINASPQAQSAQTAAAGFDSGLSVAPEPSPPQLAAIGFGPGSAATSTPDSAPAAVAGVNGVGAADHADTFPDPAVVVADASDTAASTEVLTRADAQPATPAIFPPQAAAATAVQSFPDVATTAAPGLAAVTRIATSPLLAAATVTALPPTATQVAAAVVFPGSSTVAVVAPQPDALSIYSIPAQPAVLIFRNLGSLVRRGNLALFNLDARLTQLPTGGSNPTEVTVTAPDIASVDADAVLVTADAVFAVTEIAATATAPSLDAAADTRGT